MGEEYLVKGTGLCSQPPSEAAACTPRPFPLLPSEEKRTASRAPGKARLRRGQQEVAVWRQAAKLLSWGEGRRGRPTAPWEMPCIIANKQA